MVELDRLYLEHVAALESAYAAIATAQKWDSVLIYSGGRVKRTEFDDQFWPLRASPHWQHWLPLVEPEGVLVLRPGRTPKLVRVAEGGFWEKATPPENDAFLAAFDVVGTSNAADARQHRTGAGRVAWIGENRAAGAAPEAASINPGARRSARRKDGVRSRVPRGGQQAGAARA
jgi:Xaa-Pro dipeptidase